MALFNSFKFARGFIRNKLQMVHDVSEVYQREFYPKKMKLIELIKDKADEIAKSELGRKMKVAKGYYTLEMAPPVKGDEMARLRSDLALVADFIKSGCFKYLTVKQAWLLFLVGVEIGLWFFMGETIGKWHIVGYQV